MRIYIVQKGDTLWKIAQKYGVDFEELKNLNNHLPDPDMIMPGMKIKIPTKSGGMKKEMPIKEAPKEMPVKEVPKEMPVKEVPKEMPIQKEAPKQIYMPQPPKPPVSDIDINQYFMLNMADIDVAPKIQMPAKKKPKKEMPKKEMPKKEMPKKEMPKKEVPKEEPLKEAAPETQPMPQMPMLQPCYPITPVLPGSGFPCLPMYPIMPFHGQPGFSVMPGWQQMPYTGVPGTYDQYQFDENAPNIAGVSQGGMMPMGGQGMPMYAIPQQAGTGTAKGDCGCGGQSLSYPMMPMNMMQPMMAGQSMVPPSTWGSGIDMMSYGSGWSQGMGSMDGWSTQPMGSGSMDGMTGQDMDQDSDMEGKQMDFGPYEGAAQMEGMMMPWNPMMQGQMMQGWNPMMTQGTMGMPSTGGMMPSYGTGSGQGQMQGMGGFDQSQWTQWQSMMPSGTFPPYGTYGQPTMYDSPSGYYPVAGRIPNEEEENEE